MRRTYAASIGGSRWRPRTCPLRRHGALWPQYYDGARSRVASDALPPQAETESTECRLRYLSVCSGIEAVSVAWQPLGWQPAMFAEIDPFCCWLLRSRY